MEVIAAIGLFALMTTGIVAALQQTQKISVKLRTRQASVLSGITAMDRMRRDFSMAYNENLQKTPTYFKSHDASLGPEIEFSTLDTPIRSLFSNRTPGVIVVKYKLEKADDGTFKLLRSEVPLGEKDKIDTAIPQNLGAGIMKMEVEFYDPYNDQWKKEWNSAEGSTRGVPRAVRLAIESVDPQTPEIDRKEKTLRFESRISVLNEEERSL